MRLPVIAFALASVLLPAGVSAQDTPTIPFTGGVKITVSQRVQIDSILGAYATERRKLLAHQDTMATSVPARIALYRTHRDAIRNVLTADQRIAYDAWYEATEARGPKPTAP